MAAGCEIVRLAVPDERAAEAFKEIKKRADAPLIADIHFDHRLALAALRAGADGLRINPGNIGGRKAIEKVIREAREAALAAHAPNSIRAGANIADVANCFNTYTSTGVDSWALKDIGQVLA